VSGYHHEVAYVHVYTNKAYIFIAKQLESVNKVYEYNLDNGTITVVNNNVNNFGTFGPFGLENTCFLGCLDKVIVIEGGDASCWEYDVSKNTYTNLNLTCPHLSSGMRQGSVCWTIGSKGYIYGGVGYWDQSERGDTLQIFNFNTNTWSAGSPSAISNLGSSTAVVSKGSVYIIAGKIGSGTYEQSNNVKKFSYYLDKPTGITAQYVQGNGGITLGWTDNTTEETEYVIERKADNESNYTEIALVPVVTSGVAGTLYTYTDTTADVLTRSYQYRIKARLVVL
jgi:hypothetical protein